MLWTWKISSPDPDNKRISIYSMHHTVSYLSSPSVAASTTVLIFVVRFSRLSIWRLFMQEQANAPIHWQNSLFVVRFFFFVFLLFIFLSFNSALLIILSGYFHKGKWCLPLFIDYFNLSIKKWPFNTLYKLKLSFPRQIRFCQYLLLMQCFRFFFILITCITITWLNSGYIDKQSTPMIDAPAQHTKQKIHLHSENTRLRRFSLRMIQSVERLCDTALFISRR